MSRVVPAVEQAPGTTRTLLTERRGSEIVSRVRRSVLAGGLRVVTEAMPGVRSAAVGIWVGVGSADESPGLSGASHFLEHLLFKGTSRRTALDISVALDSCGGELNAFTGREFTCYHASVLDEDLPIAIDVLTDMVAAASLSAADVEAEREVILDEIAMHDDDPDDAVHELFSAHVFGDTPLGRPVAGRPESIKALSRRQIAGYYRRRYRPESIVVSVAGSLDHAAVVREVKKSLQGTELLGSGVVGGAGSRPRPPRSAGRRPRQRSGVAVRRRTQEQANIMLGVPGLRRGDDRRYAMAVLNAAVGGGTSSRLFQEVRERRGLAYSVYSSYGGYAAAGSFAVSAGCLPNRVDDVIDVCREQLATVAAHGISADELARAKGQLRGGYVLGLEDSGSRMYRIGQAELLRGEVRSMAEHLTRIDRVTLADVAELADAVLTADPALAVVGPFDGPDRFGPLLT
ncbi:MAG TPA: pitrilysin family protein [Nocardioidaceae bacterium]|nr:pitrilysin family protein [Nocardioidaceae bacterium]